jgi:Ca2+-binding RTX toxin-like protein
MAIIGTPLNDFLAGTALADDMFGLAGNDVLRAGAGNDYMDGGDGNDSLYGGTGNDMLKGGGGADLLSGDDGNDILIGGAGGDLLFGGQGADTFKYMSVTDSTLLNSDKIADFSSADGDKIDLSAIDANSLTAANDPFSYIGAGAFTGVAGELHFIGGFLEGDVNGDGAADFRIGVSVAALGAGDLIV